MSKYLGDFNEDATVKFRWSSNDSSGASITRATNGTVQVFKGSSTTPSTAGITDTEDFAGLTGVHLCVIDTSADAFYTPGEDYTVAISGAVIDSQTVNAVLAEFSIENRNNDSDVVKINGSAPAASGLQQGTLSSIITTVTDASFTPTTTAFEVTGSISTTSSALVGRAVIFGLSASAGVKHVARKITAYDGSNQRISVDAMPSAPVNGDPLIIV